MEGEKRWKMLRAENEPPIESKPPTRALPHRETTEKQSPNRTKNIN